MSLACPPVSNDVWCLTAPHWQICKYIKDDWLDKVIPTSHGQILNSKLYTTFSPSFTFKYFEYMSTFLWKISYSKTVKYWVLYYLYVCISFTIINRQPSCCEPATKITTSSGYCVSNLTIQFIKIRCISPSNSF